MRQAPAYMIGKLVYDYALGKTGIVVGSAWVEPLCPYDDTGRSIPWEWEVLYDDGELMGADTNDLQEIV